MGAEPGRAGRRHCRTDPAGPAVPDRARSRTRLRTPAGRDRHRPDELHGEHRGGTGLCRPRRSAVDANRELVATGSANLGGALLGAMPAGGGTSQTSGVVPAEARDIRCEHLRTRRRRRRRSRPLSRRDRNAAVLRLLPVAARRRVRTRSPGARQRLRLRCQQ
ncbi:SulP family inorganic anion transporter [Methylobacterium sp. P1-11]|uniref:SulP family inorganic anion transporter n=1 Tax=Methylobacterium sp. P1-11 TaxID=2024616 RepID=UPI0032B29BC5